MAAQTVVGAAMFTIKNVSLEDVDDTTASLAEAFSTDPLMAYFFGGSPMGIRLSSARFFSILLRARLALEMPALVLKSELNAFGCAMGYDTTRPEWPALLVREWEQLESMTPGFAQRLSAYDQISEAHTPAERHYYLGVLGVHPSQQGQGAGKALLEAFCTRSRSDPLSHGVYLETASESSLQFYYHNGFSLRGEGVLETTHLWCLYKAHDLSAASSSHPSETRDVR